MSVINHKCPKCDAVLKFNPLTQNWKCEFCKSKFDLDQLKEYEKNFGDKLQEEDKVINKDEKGMKIYTCDSCGARIILDENTSATSCIYCKNTAIIKDNLVDEFSPSLVIPFRKTKNEAIDAFIKIGKGKPLMPKEFSDQNNIKEMSGIYIPFWIFDYSSNVDASFNASIIKHWTSGSYHYTKTDKYKVDIASSMDFNKVPVDGSKRFQNDIMNSIEPFDYKDLVEFNYSYLSGFLAEKYDVNSTDASLIAQERANQSALEATRSEVAKSTYTLVTNNSKTIKLEEKNGNYILLPVWMLNIKYKDKLYTFAMNGQTGKLVGDIPIDNKKAVIYAVSIFVLVFLLLFIICKIFVGA